MRVGSPDATSRNMCTALSMRCPAAVKSLIGFIVACRQRHNLLHTVSQHGIVSMISRE